MLRFYPIRSVLCSLAAALVLAAAEPSAANSFTDGAWRVTVITESGDCDQAYLYAVLISGGRVKMDPQESSGLIDISGEVDARGRVRVSVRRGEQYATGAGTLSATEGGGTWMGKSGSAVCSGRWEAKRG